MKLNNIRVANVNIVLIAVVILSSCVTITAQISRTAPAPNQNITAPAPQKHGPPAGPQQQIPGTTVPRQILQNTGAGTIEGFVYWDRASISHTPASSCSGLAVTVAVGNSTGGKSTAYQSLATLSNNFKYVGQVKQFVTGGKIKVYDVCTYGYSHVPAGPDLRVTVLADTASLSQPAPFSPMSVPQKDPLGPITIINGQCNMLPHIVNPTASDLFSHWGTCQNMAYDVNFMMQPATQVLNSRPTRVSSEPSGNQMGMLSGARQQGMLAPGTTQSATSPGNQGTLLGNSQPPASQSGGLQNPGSKVELNPQPLPPKQLLTNPAPALPRTGPPSSTQAGGAVNSIAAISGQQNTKVQPAAGRGISHMPVTALNPGFHLTNFEPTIHGFRFVNSFVNDVVPSMDVRTGGLCGGMSYSALDYYFAHTPVPQQTYRPANRTTLQSYLYNREVESLASNLDKWAEVGFNPGGSRNGEFFNWGLQGTNGGRLEELRSFIDQGIPAVMDLQGDGGTGNHQVVAFGYSMGRYQGDLKNFEDDLKIVVYDPNYPMKTRTLIPDVPNQLYRYAEGGAERWRTYFVDKNYHAQTPPSLPNPVYPNDGTVRELILSFNTGSDDMRGGNDNVDLAVDLLDGSRQLYPNINLSARWLPNYPENARVILSKPVPYNQIHDLVLTDTFGGGMGGDNWDMNSVTVNVLVNGKISPATTFGFHRFSADSDGPKARTLTIPLN